MTAVPVRVPDLGTDAGIRLVAWLVDEGEPVMEGDRIAELLITGLVVHVPAGGTGRMGPHRVPVGAAIAYGDEIGSIILDEPQAI